LFLLRKLTLYMAGEFLKTFMFSLVALLVIALGSELVEKIGLFLQQKVPLKLMAHYFVYGSPYLISLLCPLGILLGTLFSLNRLSLDNEITAMRVQGISLYQITRPILTLSILISIFMLIFDQVVVPSALEKKREIEQVQILKKPPIYAARRYNFARRGEGNQIFFIKIFDAVAEKMEDLTIWQFHADGSYIRIDAQSAEWQSGWHAHNVFYRYFNREGEVQTLFYPETDLKIVEPPERFRIKEKFPEEMSFFELRDHIANLKQAGSMVSRETVDLYHKLSLPFANILLALLGIPFALRSAHRGGKAAAFFFSLLIAFICWGINAVAKALGKGGIIGPLYSAWLPLLIFAAVGIYFFWKIEKVS